MIQCINIDVCEQVVFVLRRNILTFAARNESEVMEEKLFNKNYLCLCASNFLFFFSFYLLLPVLPFFIMERFQAGNAVIGTVISCYTLATLVVRPFSGYMMDTFKRKPLYLLALSLFTAV